jgi:hypothetical protein
MDRFLDLWVSRLFRKTYPSIRNAWTRSPFGRGNFVTTGKGRETSFCSGPLRH